MSAPVRIVRDDAYWSSGALHERHTSTLLYVDFRWPEGAPDPSTIPGFADGSGRAWWVDEDVRIVGAPKRTYGAFGGWIVPIEVADGRGSWARIADLRPLPTFTRADGTTTPERSGKDRRGMGAGRKGRATDEDQIARLWQADKFSGPMRFGRRKKARRTIPDRRTP